MASARHTRAPWRRWCAVADVEHHPDGRDDPRPAAPAPPLTRRAVLGLILAAYKAALPYFVVIVLLLLIVTWLLTEVAFRG